MSSESTFELFGYNPALTGSVNRREAAEMAKAVEDTIFEVYGVRKIMRAKGAERVRSIYVVCLVEKWPHQMQEQGLTGMERRCASCGMWRG